MLKKYMHYAILSLVLVLTGSKALAINCQVNATKSGYDMATVTATADNFICTGGTVTSATLSFTLSTPCTWTQANVIVNGITILSGVCPQTGINLTPYLPLTSVSVVAIDNPADNYSDYTTVNMTVTLNSSSNVSPLTAFTAPNYLCFGTPVQFTNNSIGGFTYQWTFGDGTTSTEFEPVHTYAQAGYYWVGLTIYDATGMQIGNQYNYVIAAGHGPNMNITQTTVCIGDEIHIWDNSYFSNNNNASYSINFGDGSPVQSSNNNWASFTHSYNAVGNYTVTMTVTSECGTQVVDTVVTVANNLQVQSYLEIGNVGSVVCPGTQVNLYTNWNYNYLFDYGDGTTGTSQTHIYNAYGTYTPSVIVQNGCGNSATYTSGNIVVGNASYFTGSAYVSSNNNSSGQTGGGGTCPGSPVSFWSPAAVSHSWNFGDGGTSTLQEPEHAYNLPGTYNVSLTLQDGCGNDTTLYYQVNIVTNLPINPNVSLNEMPTEICVSDAFEYNVQAAYEYEGAGTFLWNFGDGTTSDDRHGYHSYAAVGTYTVTCQITNTCGNDTTLTMQITAGNNIPPQNMQIFTIQEEFCPGDEIMLLAFPYSVSNTVQWNMGNGDVFNAQDTLALNVENGDMVFHLSNYSYTQPGVYNVEATVTNGCGLSSMQNIVLTIGPGATIEDAGFFVEQDEYYCLNEQIIFRGYGGNEFFWNFGDNSGAELTSTALEPVIHTYSEPGTYTVTMIAQNNCGDTMIVSQNITIPDSEMTIITNSSNSNCLQSDGSAVAYVAGPNAPYSYTWSNGQTTNIINNVPAGIYVVNVVDSKGCTDFAIATVSDAQAPTIAVSNVVAVSCYGEDNGAIDITPIGNTSGITYAWSNGETTQDISGLVSGPYEVIVTNGQGCISVESVYVPQPEGMSVEFASSPATCGLSNGTATAVVTGSTGPYIYIWSGGSGSVSSPVRNGLAGGVYTLTVIDNESCVIQGSVAISETNAPGIILDSLNDVGCGSGGSGIYTSPIGGTAPYTYSWSNGAATDDVTGLAPGQYTVSLEGANGCESNAIYTIDFETPQMNPICVVTVNDAQHNKVAWEKVAASGVASYNIYKESSSAGLYYLVGSVPYDSLSVFVDSVSNPAVQAYRYKIAAVDSCGTESTVSAHHKTIHLTQNIGIGGEVNLIWDNYEGFSYSTYNVWRYDNVNGWVMLTSLPSNVNSYSDINAPLGTATSLYYRIEIELAQVCVSTKIENNNTTRSNRTEAIAGPIENGMDELEEDNNLVVYPNPTNGEINVNVFMGNLSDVTCQLLDAQGRVVLEKQIHQLNDGAKVELNASHAESGVYMLRFVVGDRSYHKRLIIRN